jgi:hypothetical protein
MGYVNQGNQYITFDFKHKAKGYDFNRLNRNVLRRGIYRGMAISYAGTDVTISTGSVLFDTFFQPTAGITNNNIQTKIDFDASYTFNNLSPSDLTVNPLTGTYYDEILYLVYEYGEVTFNYADFRSTTIRAIESIESTAIIIGQVSFDLSQNITGFSYTNRTYGLFTYETGYALPDSTYFFNVSHPSLTTTKKWSIDGIRLSTGTHKIYIPNTTPVNNNSILEYDFLLTNEINTTVVKNNLSIGNSLSISNDFQVTGNTTLNKTFIRDTLSVTGTSTFKNSVTIEGTVFGNSENKLIVSPSINATNTNDSLSLNNGSIVTSGGISVLKSVYVGQNIVSDGTLNVRSANQSDSISNGALTVSGGIGVLKNVNVGGSLSVSGTSTFSDILNVNRLDYDYDVVNNSASGVTANYVSKSFIVVKNNNSSLATTITLSIPNTTSTFKMRNIYLLVKSNGNYSFNLTTSQGGSLRWPSGYAPSISANNSYDLYSFLTNGTDVFGTFAFNYTGSL